MQLLIYLRREPIPVKDLKGDAMRMFVLFWLLILLLPAISQGQEIVWQRTIGGSLSDGLISVAPVSDGGFICGGYSYSNISGEKTENSRGNQDYWIVKLDSSGAIQWDKTYGGSGLDELASIEQTSDGGFICIGRSDSDISGDKTESSRGGLDYWIIKLDNAGNLQWQKTIGGNGLDIPYTIKQVPTGGYIIGGHSNSNISGEKSENCKGLMDYWVVRLDDTGGILWQKTIGGDNSDQMHALDIVSSGGFVCGGWSTSGISGDKTEFTRGASDFWIVKIDDFGGILWDKTYGGNENEMCYSIIHTLDGGFVCGGFSDSGMTGDKTESNRGGDDFWILKLNSNGQLLWQRTLGGSTYDIVRSISQASDGTIIAGGFSFSGFSGDKTEASLGAMDFWLTSMDEFGNLRWQNTVGGDNFDELKSIRHTSDGGFIAGGYSGSSASGDKNENCRGGYDFWIIKFSGNNNSIQGKTFFDFNSNILQDTGEPIMRYVQISDGISGRMGFSSYNGNYFISVPDTGNYTIHASSPLSYYVAAPVSHNVYFSGYSQNDSLKDFAFQPLGLVDDLCVTITPSTPFRSGFNASYVINYENVGPTTVNNASVVFYPDNNLTFHSSNVTPVSIHPDSVTWNLGTLSPFQAGTIVVTVNVTLGVPIGTMINSGATIYPVAGDVNPICNTHYWEINVTGSFDPNDILVSRNALFNYELLNPPYLDYIIRFQNTGNDTAFTVKVLNPIDTNKLQLNTLEFTAASHPVDMRFIYHQRNLEFQFDNILLPDSNINEPLSHGFIRYRIKPKATLSVGDSIRNNAYIYFDFNNPIATNTAITEVVMNTAVNSIDDSVVLSVYPNPTSHDVTVSFVLKQAADVEMNVFNAMGQVVTSSTGKFSSGKNEITISASGLSSGIYFIKVSVKGSMVVKKMVKM